MAQPVEYDEQSALLVVDVQNDFADPRGSLSVAGGEDEDVHLEAFAPPVLQEGEAVNLGQHEVEDDGVVLGGAGLEIALLAVVGDIDRKPFLLQSLPQGPAERLVVFDQQHPHQTDS